MSATIIPLRRQPGEARERSSLSDLRAALQLGGTDTPLPPSLLDIILADLAARQAEILTTINGLRNPALRAYPRAGGFAVELERIACETRDEIEHLVRCGRALAMHGPSGDEP